MKRCLITGASKGLGLRIAQEILRNGDEVINLSRSISDELIALSEEYGGRLVNFQVDLEDIETLQDKLKQEVFRESQIDCFINNAAFAYDDIVTNIQIGELKKMFEINVYAPFVITKYFIRHCLLHNKGGSIVHISSISVHTGYKGLSMYAGSKGALEAFSRNISREWAERGIRSNCVVAGFMQTNMTATIKSDLTEKIRRRTSQKELTSLDSVASTVIFLLSEKSHSITGANLFVDSGTI